MFFVPILQKHQSSNRPAFFNHPPTLIRAATTTLGANLPDATYEFTLSVPTDAGAPLQAVMIVQAPNVDTVAFNVSKSLARSGRAVVSLASVGGAAKPGEATIVFDPLIQPGNTVTTALQAQRNPWGGVYLFGVTAYPVGEHGLGQFLGYGRLNFYSR